MQVVVLRRNHGDNNDEDDGDEDDDDQNTFGYICYFTVMLLLSLQHRVMHTKCLFHNQFSVCHSHRIHTHTQRVYEKCKPEEKDKFFASPFFLHIFLLSLSVISLSCVLFSLLCVLL